MIFMISSGDPSISVSTLDKVNLFTYFTLTLSPSLSYRFSQLFSFVVGSLNIFLNSERPVAKVS